LNSPNLTTTEGQEGNVDEHGTKKSLSHGLAIFRVSDTAYNSLMTNTEKPAKHGQDKDTKDRNTCAEVGTEGLVKQRS